MLHAEEMETDLKEIEAEALRRALKAALRREPTPRELRRALVSWTGEA